MYRKVRKGDPSVTDDDREKASERIVKHDATIPNLLANIMVTDQATQEGFKSSIARIVEELLQPLDDGQANDTGPTNGEIGYKSDKTSSPFTNLVTFACKVADDANMRVAQAKGQRRSNTNFMSKSRP